jgi:hypothetical protein
VHSAYRFEHMTTVPTLDASPSTSCRTTDYGTMSDAVFAASECNSAYSDDADDSGLSVAGEEDPGAALDVIGSGTDRPEAQTCPWLKEASA